MRFIYALLVISTTWGLLRDESLPKKNLDLPYPDLFILGAQKCGTTSLNKLLELHSAFCSEGVKEKHYFSTDDWQDPSSISSFLDEFKGCKHKITIDATPSLIAERLVPLRIKSSYTPENLRRKKFIVLLRDPASLHYSEYQRLVRGCFVLEEDAKRLSFSSRNKNVQEKVGSAEKKCQYILMKPDGKLSMENMFSFAQFTVSSYGAKQLHRGYYLAEIKEWLTVIDRSQLFILSFETLLANTTDSVSRLAKFIGVDGEEFFRVSPAEGPQGSNSSKIKLPDPPPSNRYMEYDKAKMDCDTFSRVENMWAAANAGLVEFINSNSSGARPATEPRFPPFTSARRKCHPYIWVSDGWYNGTQKVVSPSTVSQGGKRRRRRRRT
jgi:hypothetical protein